MALIKTTTDDKIEIIGEHKSIHVRTATVIKEDGAKLATTFSRRILNCVTSTHNGSSWTHTDTNVSSESAEIQAIASAVWNTTAKNAQKALNEVAI
tara:strand:+ start:407 stop:694 length:288 start_codon:yes stop_codon:yes gene_type:complete